MRRRYWLPAVALAAFGGLLYVFAYGYDFAGLICCLLAAGVLLFGLADALKGRFPRLMKHFRRIMIGGICVLLLAAIATGICIGVHAGGSKAPEAEYVIVLGAGVDGEAPSRSLRERLVAAKTYLEAYPDAVCVLSGGKRGRESITEAQCMYNWLTARGIDGSRLWLEEQATDTRENLRFSLDLIDAKTGVRPTRAVVISSEYHLLRASMLAKREGLEALGYPARTENPAYFVNMFVREICGVWVTLLFG